LSLQLDYTFIVRPQTPPQLIFFVRPNGRTDDENGGHFARTIIVDWRCRPSVQSDITTGFTVTQTLYIPVNRTVTAAHSNLQHLRHALCAGQCDDIGYRGIVYTIMLLDFYATQYSKKFRHAGRTNKNKTKIFIFESTKLYLAFLCFLRYISSV